MAILYDESSRVFRLDTDVSSYAIQIYEHGYLAHLYYGPRVTDTAALARYMCRGWFDSFSPRNPHMDNMEHVQFSLDFTPQEYPCTGSGDSRASALQVRAPEGNVVTESYVPGRIINLGVKEDRLNFGLMTEGIRCQERWQRMECWWHWLFC